MIGSLEPRPHYGGLTGLEFTMLTRLALTHSDLLAFASLPSTRIKGVHHCVWLNLGLDGSATALPLLTLDVPMHNHVAMQV